MSRDRLDRVWAQAIAAGLLPAGATRPEQESRPWPVVLLTALGAWLAAVPLLGVVGMLLGDLVHRGAGPYAIGVLVLAGALVVLRSRGVPLFVEQLAVPALLVGGGAIGFGLFRDLSTQGACAVLAAIGFALAAAIPKAWLRVLLSAAATILVATALGIDPARSAGRGGMTRFWLAWQITMALWLGVVAVQQRLLEGGQRARWAATLESMLAGGLLATLAALAWWSGSTFLVGGSGELFRDLTRSSPWARPAMQAASAIFAVAGAAWLAHGWPGLRRAWCAGVALVLVALAWFMPALGAVLLVLAVCAASQRWRVASVAALAAAWIVGAFYYQLAWPLADKAVVLVIAAAVLGALAWLAPRNPAPSPKAGAQTRTPRAASAAIALALLAVLTVANAGIWQKERLIATGRPVFVELAPVDPRSMMQGDYMQLNFRLPDTSGLELLGSKRPQVVARLDDRGVATLQRVHDGAALAPDELRIELTPKDGRWVLVSDAWFFREGEAERWARAKYGEFRVDSSGRALLVGLRGPQLEAL